MTLLRMTLLSTLVTMAACVEPEDEFDHDHTTTAEQEVLADGFYYAWGGARATGTWKVEIPYAFDASATANVRSAITSAMQAWAAASNNRVVFVPGQVAPGGYGILIKGYSGAYGFAGTSMDIDNTPITEDRTPYKIVYSSVQIPVWKKNREMGATALHEIGHALGFDHTPSEFAPSVLMASDGAARLSTYDISNMRAHYGTGQ